MNHRAPLSLKSEPILIISSSSSELYIKLSYRVPRTLLAVTCCLRCGVWRLVRARVSRDVNLLIFEQGLLVAVPLLRIPTINWTGPLSGSLSQWWTPSPDRVSSDPWPRPAEYCPNVFLSYLDLVTQQLNVKQYPVAQHSVRTDTFNKLSQRFLKVTFHRKTPKVDLVIVTPTEKSKFYINGFM